MKRQNGVTLIELMVTLSIVAVMLTIAVPGLQQFMISGKLSSIATDFISTLQFARSEAVKRGASVTICPSSDGATCVGGWGSGWIVFLDANENGAVNLGETLVRAHPAVSGNYTMASTLVNASAAAVTYITYTRSGIASDTGLIAVCNASDENTARVISVPMTRPRFENSSTIATCESP